MTSETEIAYAKLNLALHVRGRMAGGYHALETVFAFCDDGDRLSGVDAKSLSLTVTGQFKDALEGEDEDNLVLRAARAVADAFAPERGASLRLDKRLPVASGIGGGSADAAAAIRLLNRLWRLERPLSDFEAIAAKLGADVPACLFSCSAFGTGKGDDLRFVSIGGLEGRHLLLANPGKAVSTADIFRRWHGRDGGALAGLELSSLQKSARNDLEEAAVALVPDIGELLSALARHSDFARMSGSGATCFALFDSADAAATARDDLRAQFGDHWPGFWTMTAQPRIEACDDAASAPERATS
ncbi:MAG: 4-(cytidine 5'-diphospho)-2-C-methyl-D-erythritol kinase [Sphingorhabdus sp.]|nr:4-(cytidine 5'-diphospho)-2-C-methyl-D-erythritol kinase [Sphingorhabdus sp.]